MNMNNCENTKNCLECNDYAKVNSMNFHPKIWQLVSDVIWNTVTIASWYKSMNFPQKEHEENCKRRIFAVLELISIKENEEYLLNNINENNWTIDNMKLIDSLPKMKKSELN